ncbi:hypothetical protein MMC29_006279, partial [Sticta canariensis]|nr:hypothetical protein [Sticta canariensis]
QEQLARLSVRPATMKPSQQVGSPASCMGAATLKGSELDTRTLHADPAQAQDTSLMSEAQKRVAALKQQSKMAARSQGEVKANLAAFKAKLQASKLARAVAAEQQGPDNSTTAGNSQEQEAYAGKVRNDIDHNQLKPAAWRADNYLDDESDDDLDAIMRSGPLVFPKMPAKNDDMARREDVDDYAVRPGMVGWRIPWQKELQRERDGPRDTGETAKIVAMSSRGGGVSESPGRTDHANMMSVDSTGVTGHTRVRGTGTSVCMKPDMIHAATHNDIVMLWAGGDD